MKKSLFNADTVLKSGCIGIAGGVTWLAIAVSSMDLNVTHIGLLHEYRISTLGASLAGLLTHPLHRTVVPLAAGLASLVTTLLGAGFAAAILAAFASGPEAMVAGLLMGPTFVLGCILTDPFVAGIWALSMIAAQWAMLSIRSESCDFP